MNADFIIPLLKILEYCERSDDACLGTLSASMVRELVNEALDNLPSEREET